MGWEDKGLYRGLSCYSHQLRLNTRKFYSFGLSPGLEEWEGREEVVVVVLGPRSNQSRDGIRAVNIHRPQAFSEAQVLGKVFGLFVESCYSE